MALDHFSTHYQFEDWKIKFDGMFAAKLFGSEKVILVKPQTYMNLSGSCVAKFKLFFKVSEDDIDPKSIMDSNNKKRSLRDRPLIGINLLEDFPSYALDKKVLKNGKIYDPGRGRTFKSNLYLLDDGTLKVEGCLMGICDHEIWQPLVVTINEDGTRTAEPMN